MAGESRTRLSQHACRRHRRRRNAGAIAGLPRGRIGDASTRREQVQAGEGSCPGPEVELPASSSPARVALSLPPIPPHVPPPSGPSQRSGGRTTAVATNSASSPERTAEEERRAA